MIDLEKKLQASLISNKLQAEVLAYVASLERQVSVPECVNIWSTAEITAISMGFKYTEYVDFHEDYEYAGALVSEKAYQILANFFDTGLSEANEKFVPVEDADQQYGWLTDEQRRML